MREMRSVRSQAVLGALLGLLIVAIGGGLVVMVLLAR